VYACAGHWDKATPEYRLAVDLDPKSQPAHYRLAALYAWTEDLEAYRRACRDMLHWFGRSQDANLIDRAAKTCLVAPVEADVRERAIALAERNVGPDMAEHQDRRWFVLASGLAAYRAGLYAEAVTRIEQFAPITDGRHADATGFAVLAMAQHQLRQSEAAGAALASARQILSVKMPNPTEGRPFGDDFHDWLHSCVLVREAEGLIGK
jgi:hypothetical protein